MKGRKRMEDKILEITDEELEKLSPEELVDLKFEMEEMIERINEIIESCEE